MASMDRICYASCLIHRIRLYKQALAACRKCEVYLVIET